MYYQFQNSQFGKKQQPQHHKGTFESQTSSKVQLYRPVFFEEILLSAPCMNDMTNLLKLNLPMVGQDMQDGQVDHNRNTGAISFFPVVDDATNKKILLLQGPKTLVMLNEFTSSELQMSHI